MGSEASTSCRLIVRGKRSSDDDSLDLGHSRQCAVRGKVKPSPWRVLPVSTLGFQCAVEQGSVAQREVFAVNDLPSFSKPSPHEVLDLAHPIIRLRGYARVQGSFRLDVRVLRPTVPGLPLT